MLPLPGPYYAYWWTGSQNGYPLRLAQQDIIATHPVLSHERGQWWIRDPRGSTGLKEDGVSRTAVCLTPGVEIGIGTFVYVAESSRTIALRDFCARLLGRDHPTAIDHALRAIRVAYACRSPLTLEGDGDMIPIAQAMHRRILGDHAPFVVCDRRRRSLRASVRSAANFVNMEDAMKAAAGDRFACAACDCRATFRAG